MHFSNYRCAAVTESEKEGDCVLPNAEALSKGADIPYADLNLRDQPPYSSTWSKTGMKIYISSRFKAKGRDLCELVL